VMSAPIRLMRRNRGKRGVVLVLVVWTLALMSALVVEFDSSMRVEVEGTGNYKDELQAYYLARAAIELAVAEAVNVGGPAYGADSGEIIYTKGDYAREEEEEIDEETDTMTYRREIEFAGGEISYAMFDEEGRYNLNSVRPTKTWVLAKLLTESAGMEMGAERDTVMDSIMDWTDVDELRMINGAEEDYYQSLPKPYHCKDGDFYVPEEALYVKGMTKEIFYGGAPAAPGSDDETAAGLFPYITTFSSRRGGGEYEFHVATARPELREIMGLRPDIRATANPTLIRIVGRGSVRDGKVVRTIEAVVRVSRVYRAGSYEFRPGGQKMWEVVYWDDHSARELPESEESEAL